MSNTRTITDHLLWDQRIGFDRMKAFATNRQALNNSQAGINLFGIEKFPSISINNIDGVVGNSLGFGPGSNFSNEGMFQTRYSPSTNLNWVRGNHQMSFGFQYEFTQLNIINRANEVASLNFQTFADFLTGNLNGSSSSLLQGQSNRYYRSQQIGSYAQDKWKLRPNLTLTLGVRYDWDGPLVEKYGNLFNFDPTRYKYDPATDTIVNDGFIVAGNNKLFPTHGAGDSTLKGRQWGVGPRIGIAYSPLKNVVFRTGFGIYYDRGEYFTYLSPGAGSGISGPFGVTQEPPLVIPVTPTAGATLSQPFGTVRPPQPSGNPADFASLLPNIAALEGGANDFPFGSYDIHNQLPYTENWSLDLQWQPLNDLAITLGYNGNRGRHEVLPIPFNQPGIATPQNPIHGQIYSYGYQIAGVSAEQFNTFNGGNVDLRVPFIGYSPNAVAYRASGVSAYDALLLNVQKRFTHGFQFGGSYTWSHSFDESSALGLFYNGNNPLVPRDSYAPSDYDRTHVVSFNYTYQLPDFAPTKSLLGKIVDGWGMSGITVLQSGQPYSVVDFSGSIASIYYSFNDSITNPIVPLAPGVQPSQAVTGHSGAFPGLPALNPNFFAIPFIAPGTGGVPPCDPVTGTCDNFETGFGRGGRNIFRQGFQKRADVSIFKVLP
ncbi:MAG: TonB-dependent receptor, partial [Acidobacteriales bacterium]|nr:TonB-dependent receptor [Terriglobales bacterium]